MTVQGDEIKRVPASLTNAKPVEDAPSLALVDELAELNNSPDTKALIDNDPVGVLALLIARAKLAVASRQAGPT